LADLPARPPTIRCVFCAEEIQPEAVFCRHCGRRVLTDATKVHTIGSRHVLGEMAYGWAIWDVSAGGEPVQRFTKNEAGWDAATRTYTQLESRMAPAAPTRGAAGGAPPGQVWGIVSIVSGVVGLLVLPIIFGPVAIITGFVAISQGYRAGWLGAILGTIATILVILVLADVINALNSF
jgi:hypothetical protein